jgi:enoyl-CoA hydratase
VKRSLVAGAGGLFRLPRQVGKAVALEAILTGDPLSSQRAYELGMVNKVVPEAQVMDEAMKLAARITANAPLAVKASRAVALDAMTKTDDELWKASGVAFASLVNTEDYKEGPRAFIEKRPPVWKGK